MMVLFINDRDLYNHRYRGHLMDYFETKGVSIESRGFFDGLIQFCWTILSVFLAKFSVSSNLRANLIFMTLFWWKRGIVILNGQGRLKRCKWFRFLLSSLLRLNASYKVILIQNYSDYRLYRKVGNNNIYWVPGSGGTLKSKGVNTGLFLVTRPEKIELTIKCLETLPTTSIMDGITVVGIRQLDLNHVAMRNINLKGVGFVPQNEIFNFGDTFLQPFGYGEGIPHTLVDAIISDVDVIIHKKSYYEFGLNKLNFTFEVLSGDWGKLYWSEAEMLKVQAINQTIYDYYKFMTS